MMGVQPANEAPPCGWKYHKGFAVTGKLQMSKVALWTALEPCRIRPFVKNASTNEKIRMLPSERSEGDRCRSVKKNGTADYGRQAFWLADLSTGRAFPVNPVAFRGGRPRLQQ